MLLLDGHGSRFESVFLEYVSDAQDKWTIYIGLPYGTNVWQVGDSAEQNGTLKIAGKKKRFCSTGKVMALFGVQD
jgi:hypothetical protein